MYSILSSLSLLFFENIPFLLLCASSLSFSSI